MSATIAITQLGAAVRELEAYLAVLSDITCTKDELMELDVLGSKLTDAATTVQTKTGSFRLPHERQGWVASAKLRSQAQSTVRSLTMDGRLERPVLFRRNITMIYTGPKDSEFDSDDVRSRKAVTRHRCKRIRELGPDGVVAWAASYTPTSWAAGCMGKDVFECLVDDMELLSAQNWPAVIQETVQKLRSDEEALQDSVEFAGLINAVIESPRQAQAHERKRRRTSDGDQTQIDQQIATSSEAHVNRTPPWNPEPSGSSTSLYQQSFDNASLVFIPILYLPLGKKGYSRYVHSLTPDVQFYKYSGLLTSQLEHICGPYLSNAIKTSSLWDGAAATHCFGIAFPSNPFQDAIVVMSISQLAGTQLVQFIDSMPPIPSPHEPHIQREH